MTKAARYTVLIDRALGESDGHGAHHNGRGEAAVEQLARELQEAWTTSGSVSGFFRIVSRQLVEWPATETGLGQLPTHFEDEPPVWGAEPTPADYAGRIRFLGAMLADVMADLPAGEAAIALDTALDSIDSAIRTLESEDEL